jgi:gliding motility-associated-like protein
MKFQAPNPKSQTNPKLKNSNTQIPSNVTQSPNRQILKSSNLQIILFLLLSTSLFAQNEANVWYVQWKAGLDFNSGAPEVLYDGKVGTGTANATISDSLGNYLFSCDWHAYYTKNSSIMQNGVVSLCPGFYGLSIVKWPGQNGLYYVFTAGHDFDQGFFYSIVDMKLFDGLGAVIEKSVAVESGYDVCSRIATVKKPGTQDVWVLTRKFTEDAIVAYLVTENGFNSNPVLSFMPDREVDWYNEDGPIKISPDKKFLVSGYAMGSSACGEIEVCRFNAENGTVEYLYTHKGLLNTPPYGLRGFEFSPDSRYIYMSFSNLSNQNTSIYQFDLKLIADSVMFKNSALLIGTGKAYGLQLARDGKIYCGKVSFIPDFFRQYVGVIHQPWIRGAGCMYEDLGVNLYPNMVDYVLPNILVDYLLRFEWTGEACQGYPIHFKPNFIPTPDSIAWNFDDQLAPGSLSNELSPTYSFKHAGTHEVKVDVWYPSGRYEHTSREIEISPSPLPLLGNDTLICNGASIILHANCQADFFSWSTGQFGISSITVSDSGTYWVKGRFNDSGCEGYDTIHIGFHQPTLIDETNLQITPTTCNGASGSISGLAAVGTPPFFYRWKDLSEVQVGMDIDVSGLPAGQYYLTITDANGCETVSDVYTIEDAGNLQVLDVELTRPHCGRPDGEIVIHAFSPAGSALQYSIDDGATYQADSVFTGLVDSGYVVRVTDGLGCFGFYIDNPVLLEDIPGPQVTQVNVTDETDFLGNGAIEIVATGSTPVIFYSIDSGATYQLNNGTFNNLGSGIYNLQIWDENGCDTTFTVEIQNVILTYLHAVTGEEGICEASTALIPVNVDNFNNVAEFHLKLGYNADNLECEGFANVNVQLLDSLSGWVDQAAGDIHLAWSGELPLTFSQPEKIADLVFTTKNPGQGELAWYTGETESYFTSSGGNPIPAEFSTGQVTVYEPPEIILDQSKTVCTGQFTNLMSIAVGNQNPLTFRWIYPAGDTTSNDPFFFNITQSDAGIYTLLATDRVGCTDQKSIELIVSENPVAVFHGTDTLEMQIGDVLDAGEGMASYRWSPGDTTQSIVIQEAGMYSVEMESQIGCIGSDSVYVKLVSEEIPDFEIYVPNAFTPDGDGVNDIFSPIYEGISIFKFQISIFDRWGGQIFRSEDISIGWEGKKAGKDCPGGVYVYKIVFSVYGAPGNQERVGTVMLVR